MRQDELRAPTFLFQLLCYARHTSSTLKALMPKLATHGHPLQSNRFLVSQQSALKSNRTLVRSNRHQLMTPLLEMGSQLPELSWKILMNQQQPHNQIQ